MPPLWGLYPWPFEHFRSAEPLHFVESLRSKELLHFYEWSAEDQGFVAAAWMSVMYWSRLRVGPKTWAMTKR